MAKETDSISNKIFLHEDIRQSQLNNDELFSDEVNDIISHKPNWIIRRGVSIIALVVLLLILFSWFIRYPDTLSASMNIVALHAPIKILARTEGKLQLLLAKNGQRVKANQPLAYLQSTANHNEVISMLSGVKEIERLVLKGGMQALNSVPPLQYASIGELQQSYYEFQSAYQETLQTLPSKYYSQRIDGIMKDIRYIHEQNDISLKQKQLALEDFEIQENEFKVRELLAKDQVIAPLEFEQDKSKLIAKSSAVQQMETQLLNQKVSIHSKQKELMSVEKEMVEIQNKFLPALLVFKNKIEEWINNYVVLSPENGRVQFVNALYENQPVHNGQELFYVEPENSEFYGEVVANQKGFGKVDVGQVVIVRVESYPSAEFGYLRGNVSSISSLLVNDSSYLVNVELPDGLQTNYGRVIPFKNNMKAKAEIITQERRLLKKMFSTILDGARQ